MSDYVMTIDSDDEAEIQNSSHQDGQLDPDFTFEAHGDPYSTFFADPNLPGPSSQTPASVDDIIARRKRKLEDLEGSGSEDNNSDWESDPNSSNESSPSDDDEQDGYSDDDENSSDASVVSPQEDFFDSEQPSGKAHTSFLTMNLSRPVVKALTALNFSKPTPIQAATIPVALLGKDIVGNAVTGSGKTAAFIIPMLERLLHRDKGKHAAATRCLVLVPTRELGVQCFEVGTKLAAHTDVRFCLVVGGLSLKSQEASLRERPDIVIATPGRLIDHIRNSMSFTLDALDILVLDEADRMLSEGFADELTEIVKSCPKSRQTMLFSATMTDSVDELVAMSLNKPARLFVDPKRTTARNLVQEFVRVRSEKEDDRSAILVTLCKRSFKTKTIVFLRSKKLAHQLRIVFSLLGMKCGELHGDLSQEQRLQSLAQFRDGAVDYLMATDLASRGLDIKGIETVINFDMPTDLAQYLHRVGRTARAGAHGRSVTLVGESDRKILKAAMKHSAAEEQIRHRILPPDAVAKWAAKLAQMKGEISEVMREEKEEKELAKAERELRKGQNIMEHADNIYSRPARTWFQSEKDKAKAKAVSKEEYEAGLPSKSKSKDSNTGEQKPKRDKFSGLSRKAKRRKLAADDDHDIRADDAAIRSAKRAGRPSKIGVPEIRKGSKKARKKKESKRKLSKSIGFGRDLGQKAVKGHAREGTRAKKNQKVKGASAKSKKR